MRATKYPFPIDIDHGSHTDPIQIYSRRSKSAADDDPSIIQQNLIKSDLDTLVFRCFTNDS